MVIEIREYSIFGFTTGFQDVNIYKYWQILNSAELSKSM